MLHVSLIWVLPTELTIIVLRKRRSKALLCCIWALLHRREETLFTSLSHLAHISLFWFLTAVVKPEFTKGDNNWPWDCQSLQVTG